MCGYLSRAPYWGTWPAAQACAVDLELNQRPFGSQACTQSTKPHQPGRNINFFVPLMYSLVDSCMCPDWGSNRHLDVLEQGSNQLPSQGLFNFLRNHQVVLSILLTLCIRSSQWLCQGEPPPPILKTRIMRLKDEESRAKGHTSGT